MNNSKLGPKNNFEIGTVYLKVSMCTIGDSQFKYQQKHVVVFVVYIQIGYQAYGRLKNIRCFIKKKAILKVRQNDCLL